ncbi:hypothetical protein [Pseudobacteroides cellulosolvens]|uniref:Uncharacterized protein n=1 Tax=Pseudobacteroides cellulosolvens ATCC 35603 = DSM 2933 TaxID=398512 RepID=A0A0L6JMX5_9FIRM|nr:hypothetical protein [Pseudobacteroides cellulosolvens]KNY27119.1 hypothetical protein Bccel_2384 [Pseudobacteroides cellulosolvens ATCC 35603 = DSM 2933]
MKVLGKAVQSIIRRPFILVYFGFIALVYSIIDSRNPLTALLMGFNRLGKGDFLDMIIYSIQILLNIMMNPGTALKALIGFILILLFASILIGLIFSGYFNVINNAVGKKEKYKGEFLEGIKKFFLRISFVSLRAVLVSIIVLIVTLVASVPAVIITKSWLSGRADLTVVAAFVDVITIGVIFLIFMFYSTYISFWFPASVNNSRRWFLTGKENADKFFWKISVRYIVFIVVFMVCHFFLAKINVNSADADFAMNIKKFAGFIANWVFNTLFFGFFITYVFSVYKIAESYVPQDVEYE